MSPPKEIRRGNLQRASSAAAARILESLVFIITIIYPIVISNPIVDFHINFLSSILHSYYYDVAICLHV
jgi:hypothetical protein